MRKMYTALTIALFAIMGNRICAQQVYKTVSGDIAVSISFGDTTQLMVSHDIFVILNYENSKLYFRIPVETFKTGVDSIDEVISKKRGQIVEFNGKLSITINPRVFAAQRYLLDGMLTVGNLALPINGTGSMTCMAAANNSTPACTLLLSFESTLSALNLTELFPGARDAIRVDMRQSILERQTQ